MPSVPSGALLCDQGGTEIALIMSKASGFPIHIPKLTLSNNMLMGPLLIEVFLNKFDEVHSCRR